MQLSFIVAFAPLGVLQVGAIVLFIRQQRTIDRLSSRLTNLVAGVSLLTDTTETGLRDVAGEIGRMAASSVVAKPRPRAATQRRMSTAAKRGQTVQEIAAAEQVSEGEVSLRLQLADVAARRKTAADVTVS